MRGSIARWRVALRIARRGSLTSWGRSLLIVLLIAAPITGLAATAVLLPSRQPTLQERIDNTLGHAQAKLTVVGGPKDHLTQGVEGGYDFQTPGDMESEDSTRVDPRTLLPASTTVLAITTGSANFAREAGEISLSVTTGPTWDPSLNGGPYQLLSGRRPTATDEVLLSPAALTRLGAHVGGTVRMTAPEARTLSVVGTSRDRSLPASVPSVFAATALLPDVATSTDQNTYYVTNLPITWPITQRLNAAGITAYSRVVVTDPPAAAVQVSGTRGDSTPFTALVVGLAVVFAVMEVALLAGAAFLVGARLQQRMLATIASVGAERSVLQRIVTANGVVLGLLGGVLGTGLGIAGALIVMRATDDGAWTTYPGVHLIWPALVGIVVFGVIVGWIASLVPARAASRFDVIRALRGARTPQRTGKKPVVGLVLLVGGIMMTLLGGGALFAALKITDGSNNLPLIGALVLLGGGPVIAQLGVLLCAGLVLRGVATLVGGRSLAARLASRDIARNLGRAVPAVASVMTTVFVAAFVMCVANTASQQSAAQYYWQSPVIGHATAQIFAGSRSVTDSDAAAWVRVLRADLPIAGAAVTGQSKQLDGSDTTPSGRTRDALAQVRFPTVPASCTAKDRRNPADLRCGARTASGGNGSSAQNSVTVGDASALALLLGHAPSSAAIAALTSGGAVALRSDLAPGGTATLDWFTPKQLLAGDPSSLQPKRITHLAAVVDLPTNPVPDSLLVSSATAARLGLDPVPVQVLASFSRTPTQSELDSANAALGALANSPSGASISIEKGPQDFGSQIAWWILLACLVIAISAGATAIGLARVDGRADDLTLASLGAAARIRKSIAFVQALIVCGLGALIGTALGLLPAVALGAATTSLPFSPPTLQLVLVAIGIPVVIAVGSWVLVGTRKADLTRRAAIA